MHSLLTLSHRVLLVLSKIKIEKIVIRTLSVYYLFIDFKISAK